jgi:chromosome segregation ATPase
MNKFQKHLPKILGAACILLATGVAVMTLQVSSLNAEITNLQVALKEKSDQISRMQQDLGTEVNARNACEASIQPLKDQIAAAESKLESFALQASVCEQIRRKLKK